MSLNDAQLITHRFRPEWLVDWLVGALPIVSPTGRRVIVPDCAWHLGDTKCGDTLVTAVFARRIKDQVALGQLVSGLRSVHPADKAVVITTSLSVVRTVLLPDGYEFIYLPDLVVPRAGGLALDHDRFGTWIRGMPSRTAKGAPTRSGRPSQVATVAKIFGLRRAGGIPIDSYSAEARAIIAVWKRHAPDQKAPAIGTVRSHVSRMAKSLPELPA